MLFTHGWGKSRHWDMAKMEHTCDLYDLVCVSVEFRQSGFAFDPKSGSGWECPYDLSFYQLFDVLNGLRQVLRLNRTLNTKRLFHYGGSQGGHIALLSAIVAPKTFAMIYASCAATFVETHFLQWAGRELLPHELSFRNVIEHADRIECPIYPEHGTADKEVPPEHSQKLEQRLRQLGKPVDARYIEGAGHQLEPVTTRLDAFKTTVQRYLRSTANENAPDLLSGVRYEIPCSERTLIVDWSKPAEDAALLQWI